MNLKYLNFFGIIFLFVGLLWLNAHEIFPMDEMENEWNILWISLPGLIPTFLGIFLLDKVEKRNKAEKVSKKLHA